MEPDFEDLFADELDALRDLEENDAPTIEVPDRHSRKSLTFSTPSNKAKKPVATSIVSPCPTTAVLDDKLDDSFAAPLQPSPVPASGKRRESRKRLQDDLFGALSDDDVDEELPDLVPIRKRARTTNGMMPSIKPTVGDDHFEITPSSSPGNSDISRILALRGQHKSQGGATSFQEYEHHIMKDYDLERRRVLKRIPLDGRSVHVTAEDGSRVYMSLRDEGAIVKRLQKEAMHRKNTQLLGTPIAVLKAQLEEEASRKAIAEIERISGANDSNASDVVMTMDNMADKATNENAALWVDRYAPHQYTELLSDEGINRTLLKWLRLWDHVVFGKPKKTVKPKDSSAKEPTNKFKRGPEFSEELDQHNRPLNKVALLCGAPGLGKTTLAHIIARHAGYSVVEMNASDDRSVEVFKQKIESATQMRAVLDSERKPNCLVIDEIDGAPQPAINVLLSTLNAGEKPEKKRGQQKSNLLLRPIICICNDLYVPSLRQLRQNAFIVNFPPTLAAKLASRLLEISRKEQLKTDLTTLLSLCEKSENDIRSCLNTLQFVQKRGFGLTQHEIQSTSIGQKDSQKSLFSVWQHIFQLPKLKKKRYINPHDRTENMLTSEEPPTELNTSSASRFHNTLQMAQAAGEHDKVLQGLHENYLEAKVKDPHMDGVVLATEWVCFTDLLCHDVARSQNYALMRYVSYLPVLFHLLFASNAPLKITYPHAQFEFRTKKTKSENLVTSMMNEMQPCVKKNLNLSVAIIDLLPPLMDIIQPTLRPVNTQLYSKREKENLTELIHIMVAYNITYHQQRTPDGVYEYHLEPNLDEVVRFPGQKAVNQLTYAAKQLIAREIGLEKMRRHESSTEHKNEEKAKTSRPKPDLPPNFKRQNLQPKAVVTTPDKPVLDFFGRKLSHSAQKAKKMDVNYERLGGEIWFRFKEGYTNAVRKTVRIQDFM